jgi:PIN domain nuclease of toxin-antitoxin system
MIKYALDASALLALINKEKGWEKVQNALQHSIMSAVNLSECAAVLSLLKIPQVEIVELLSSLVPDAESFDIEQAYIAAELRNKTKEKGLSLGDRACLALCTVKHLTAITADKAWRDARCGVSVECVR